MILYVFTRITPDMLYLGREQQIQATNFENISNVNLKSLDHQTKELSLDRRLVLSEGDA
jgi:hypothetical protein